MPTGAAMRLARGASTAIDLDTEEGRAFLQQRLAFYNRVCFLISGAFFVVSGVLNGLGIEPPEPISRGQERQAMLLHATTLVVQLLAWLLLARGPRLAD